MMRNSVFIVLFIISCVCQISVVTGRKCTESDHRPYSHACMFQCIEHFYDKKFCNTCSTKTNRIKLIENAILDSLLMYDFVRYDNDTESIISMPACSGCKLEESAEHTFVEYMPPHVLHAFLELTVNSHQTKVNQTIVQRIHELHTNITKHFDDNGDEWCVNALGIAAEFNKFKLKMENTTIDSEPKSSATTDETIAAGTTTTNPTDDSLVNERAHAASTTMDNVMTNATESSSTTQMPNMPSTSIDPTSAAPESSKNSTTTTTTTTKNKKNIQLHDHHYHYSVTIITIVSLILLTVLIVSIILIGLYVNRNKRMSNAHLTSSSTYVFDQQH